MKRIALMLALVLLAGALAAWAFGCSETTNSSEKDGGSDADTDTDTDADGDGGITDFGDDCNLDSGLCDGICVEFPQLGAVCTMECTDDSQCPSGSQDQKCNKQGYCRP